MEHFHVLLAEGAKPPAPTGKGKSPRPDYFGSMFVPMLIVFVIFYIIMIRPQRRKEQTRREMLDTLEKGDKVVTIGGVHGQLVTVREKDVVIRVDDDKGVKLRMNRSAVSRVIKEDGDAEDEE